MEDPLDLRTPEERKKDEAVAELANLCESSRLLAAFREVGVSCPATIKDLAGHLGLPDAEEAPIYLQARMDDLARMGWVTRPDSETYKVNLLEWISDLRRG